MNSNNWNVGLPLAQDNGWRWYASENLQGPSIAELAASANTLVYPADIQFAHQVFKEFLSIRRDSKLFRLTTEQDIIDRVGFHNLGSNQTHGVIVMSIDDGLGLPDLDPNNDAIVVMINATDTEQSHTVPTATGFVLHPTLVNSVDPNMANVQFTEGSNEGTFTVPARTMAVFVKPQGAQQGEGLSAYATAGAPDVVPYGSTAVYIRGAMNGWGTSDQMEYVGQGVYRVAINLTAGTNYEFKFASEDWSTVNYGNSDGAVTEGADKPLVYNAGNLNFTPAVTSEYFFEVNASDPNAPVLRIRNADLYQGTAIYVRGGINGWGTGSELVYQGNGIYKVIIDIGSNTGSQEFKIASADWSTVDLSFGDGNAAVTEDEPKLLGPGAGMGNMTMDFTAPGEYTFILDASNPNVQYLSVHQTQMYGNQTIYLKGSFNGWGNVDELVYQGDSTYQVDMVLTAGNYEFKFANADWSDINYGALADDPVITIGEPKTLYYNAANIQLTIPADGTYRFKVTGPNENAPKMTITPL
jgi:pullulanase